MSENRASLYIYGPLKYEHLDEFLENLMDSYFWDADVGYNKANHHTKEWLLLQIGRAINAEHTYYNANINFRSDDTQWEPDVCDWCEENGVGYTVHFDTDYDSQGESRSWYPDPDKKDGGEKYTITTTSDGEAVITIRELKKHNSWTAMERLFEEADMAIGKDHTRLTVDDKLRDMATAALVRKKMEVAA